MRFIGNSRFYCRLVQEILLKKQVESYSSTFGAFSLTSFHTYIYMMLIRHINTRAMAWVVTNYIAGTTEIALLLGATKVLVIQVHHERRMISESVWIVADSTGLDRCTIAETS